jgi:hypothetical protein
MADGPYAPARRVGGGIAESPAPANLADILERVLDKGIVIAGDIQINLLDIELLTIKLRLLVASVDKAIQGMMQLQKPCLIRSAHRKSRVVTPRSVLSWRLTRMPRGGSGLSRILSLLVGWRR